MFPRSTMGDGRERASRFRGLKPRHERTGIGRHRRRHERRAGDRVIGHRAGAECAPFQRHHRAMRLYHACAPYLSGQP